MGHIVFRSSPRGLRTIPRTSTTTRLLGPGWPSPRPLSNSFSSLLTLRPVTPTRLGGGHQLRLSSSKPAPEQPARLPQARPSLGPTVSVKNKSTLLKPDDTQPTTSSSRAEELATRDRCQDDRPSPHQASDPPHPTIPPDPAQDHRHLTTETSSSTLASQMLQVTSDLPPSSASTQSNERTGAKSKLTGKRPLSSVDRRRMLITRILGSLVLSFAGIWTWNQSRQWDDQVERRMLGKGEDGTRLTRLQARLLDLLDYFNKPAWNPLLPPPLPEPHFRPYTLLIDLDDLLVHSNWDREHGWRTAKRPGVDYFLSYLSQLYEIVIFTTQPAYTAAPICEKLDPYGAYAPYKLFKESCRTKGLIKPQLIKDLDYLGRDLRKVVYVETDPKLVQLHPINGFIIPKWNGDPQDTGLVDLIPLLEAIVFNAVNDIRDVSRAYQGRDPVKAYAESEARQKKELLLKWHQEREKKKSGLHFDLRGLFGLGSSNTDEVPKLLVEKDRARAQQAYLEEQKYWKENEATFKKLMEEDRERQMAEMKGSLLGFLTGSVGPRPPSPDQEQQPTSPSSNLSSPSPSGSSSSQ